MNHQIKRGVSLTACGHATSFFLAISFTVCVAFDLIFPEHAMYEAWIKFLSGFEWISWKNFFIGLFESYLYGWYFALIWVPLFNFFHYRREKQLSE